MTNSVYGFIESRCTINFEDFFELLEQEKGLGIKLTEKNLLYGFPTEILNRFNSKCGAFIIADNPQKDYIAYLTSPHDFAPDAKIGLPVKLNDRLMLLTDFFKYMVDKAKAKQKDFSLWNNQPNCIYDIELDDV